MKSGIRNTFTVYASIIAVGLLIIQSCTKEPTPDFSYAPSTNPEAGDSIHFTNLSLDATSYEWDFGDGTTSVKDNPSTVYETPGSYEVTLNAINEKATVPISKTIQINEPTGMGVFAFLDDTATIVPDALVAIYNSEEDWNDYITVAEDNADEDGFVLFLNLEVQAYIVDLYHETDSGVWFSAWWTDVLTQNQIDLYGLPMDFYPDETKKALLKEHAAIKELRPARELKMRKD
ncbi:PKD domain-containing protein [Bacteroidota bacterium]